MHFVASLKPGSYHVQIGRAKNKIKLRIHGLDFEWNGRQYRTGILSDLPQEVLDDPGILVAAAGVAGKPTSLGVGAIAMAVEPSSLARGKPGPKPKNPPVA